MCTAHAASAEHLNVPSSPRPLRKGQTPLVHEQTPVPVSQTPTPVPGARPKFFRSGGTQADRVDFKPKPLKNSDYPVHWNGAVVFVDVANCVPQLRIQHPRPKRSSGTTFVLQQLARLPALRQCSVLAMV